MKHESHYKMFIFLPLTALFGVLFTLYGFMHLGKNIYMNWEYPQNRHIKESAQTTHNVALLALGNSRIKSGFIPLLANQIYANDSTSLNISLGGATSIISYYILKRYLAHNTAPKVLILSMSAEFYAKPMAELWERFVKFDFLDYGEFSEIVDNAKNLGACEILNIADGACKKSRFWTYKLDYNHYNAEIFNAIWEFWKYKHARWRVNREVTKQLWKYKGHIFYGRLNGTSGYFAEVAMQDFTPNPLYMLYLQKIADLAKAHNIAVFHYQMPLNQTSANALNPHFVEQYNAFLNSLESRFGIISLNPLISMPDSAFGDPSHLFNGAEEVTHDILEKLRQKGF